MNKRIGSIIIGFFLLLTGGILIFTLLIFPLSDTMNIINGLVGSILLVSGFTWILTAPKEDTTLA
jgi:hypothetical protein